MILSIDTAHPQKASLALCSESGKIVDTQEFESGRQLGEELLSRLSGLLEKNNLTPTDLTQVRVNTGPGPFTSLRIGVAVANALAYALGISVNGQALVVPEYGKEANIGFPKKK